MTPQTAPRNAAELAKLGIFQLRLLIQDCGGLADEPSKLAFAKMTADQKVELARQLLDVWDRANGGGGAPMQNGASLQGMMPPPGAQPVMQQPVMQQAPPMQQQAPQMMAPPGYAPQMMAPQEVNPAALAAAATNGVERSPSNKQSKKAGDPDLAANVLSMLNQISSAQAEQANSFGAAIRELRDIVTELQKPAGMEEHLKSLDRSYGGVYNVLTTFDQRLSQANQTALLAVSLSMFLAESVLGAPRDQILQMAAGDLPSIQSLLGAATGK
jgi:hypothetical protein